MQRSGDQTVERLLDWLDRNTGRTFFVWLHLYDAHSPYDSPEPFRSRYAGRSYDGAIAFEDEQVGRVIARLRALNLYDNTLVALVSDHGESLGEHDESEHGFFIYSATLRVPMIVKLPDGIIHATVRQKVDPSGGTTQGRVVAEPVALVDLAPTNGALAKLRPEETRSFQGRSLLRTIPGPFPATNPSATPAAVGRAGAGYQATATEGAAAYAESYYSLDSFGWHELRALITSQFKYIDAPRAELYNLENDPEERTNIIARNSALAAALHDRLSELETRFAAQGRSARAEPLDPETLEKLKSLGYVGYKAPSPGDRDGAGEADPKDKIATFNRILSAGDLTRTGKYAEADQLLARLEEEEPDLYVVPFGRGENYLGWGKTQPALQEFRKSLSRNPTFDQAALGLARVYFLTGQDEQAATALELALRLSPRNFLARLALAKVYWRQNLLEKALPELEQVVKTHPEFAEGHADYGIGLAKLQEYGRASPEIQRAIEPGYSVDSLQLPRYCVRRAGQSGGRHSSLREGSGTEPKVCGSLPQPGHGIPQIRPTREGSGLLQESVRAQRRAVPPVRPTVLARALAKGVDIHSSRRT